MNDDAFYFNIRQGSVLFAHRHLLHRVQHLQAVDNLAEYGVLVVQVRLSAVSYVELRPIRVWTIICEGEYSPFICFCKQNGEPKDTEIDSTSFTVSEVVMKFIFKSAAPYRLATFSRICRVAALKVNEANDLLHRIICISKSILTFIAIKTWIIKPLILL